MSIAANYVSADIFTIDADYKDILVPNIAIRANCGTDGIKIIYANNIQYKGGKTIVSLIPSESDDLTANLVEVDFSCIKPNTLKAMGYYGNIPVDWIWLYRNYRKGFNLVWVSNDRIDINPGWMHINYEGREILAVLESAVSLTGFTSASLTINTWYYIYLNPATDDTCVIPASTSSFFYTTVSPIWNSTSLQWCYPNDTQVKCIGFFYSLSSGSGVRFFQWDRKFFYFDNRANSEINTPYWSNWQRYMSVDMPLTIPSDFRIFAWCNVHFFWGYADTRYLYVRPYGCARDAINDWITRHVGSSVYGSENACIIMPIETTKQYGLKSDADFNVSYGLYVRSKTSSFRLPMGFCETY